MTPKEFHISKKDGIYLFASSECKKCEQQKKLMTHISYTLIECELDPELIYQNYNVDLIPVVRVYKNGEIVFEKILSGNDKLEEIWSYV